jgi:hypothetical protein
MPTTYTPFADELELEANDTQHENAITYKNEQYAAYSPFNSTYEAEATLCLGWWHMKQKAKQGS